MVSTCRFSETCVIETPAFNIASWMFATRSFSGNDCKQYRILRGSRQKCAKLNAVACQRVSRRTYYQKSAYS